MRMHNISQLQMRLYLRSGKSRVHGHFFSLRFRARLETSVKRGIII